MYNVQDVIKAARGLRAYLAVDPEGMPHLGGTQAKLAGSLIGMRKFKCEWSGKCQWALQGSPAWSDNRLRSAGIDPVTWRITDKRRAAFAWQQLRTDPHHYSASRQEILVGDANNETPDLHVPLIYSDQRDNLKPKTEPAQKQHFKREIIDYLRDRGAV